ncbi:c-type cytochrome [Cohnella panacarvi]|uniref:c-type cytochrome n=1 Tax=Cohnella panacarvi TaxID=400776 RepID=UPI00047A5179|nr:cytochrome c [Cohnella panacarvi]
MKPSTFYCTSLLLVAMLSACGNNNNNNVTPSPSPTGAVTPSPGGTTGVQASNAEAIYQQSCIACHGADLGGNVNLQHVGAEMSAEQIATQIANGGGGMPPFKGRLTEDEIKALADWLAAKK